MQIQIEEELVVAKRRPDSSYNFTVTTRLGEILNLVESRFGPRDQSFTILGVEFHDGQPDIWFPGDRKHVAIRLGRVTLGRPAHAAFQLAHECVHLLDPAPGGTNNLEEGVAAVFQLHYIASLDPQNGWHLDDARYEAAALRLAPLLDSLPSLVRSYREKFGPLRDATVDRLKRMAPNIPNDIAEELCFPFSVSAEPLRNRDRNSFPPGVEHEDAR